MKERAIGFWHGFIITLILLLIAYVVCECEDEPEYSNDFQYSEYEWTGPLCDDFSEYMCWKAKIDYNDSEWRISCPKCGIAYIEQMDDGSCFTSFSIDATVEPMRIACLECLYPIGRDWNIVELIPEDPIYEQLEWDCVCGEHLSATYIKPYYRFECSKCGAISTNTEYDTVEEFYELVGFEEKFIDDPDEPNEANYKSWVGL